MTLYVTGKNDTFWHYCKNCSRYPEDITATTTKRPDDDLCPQCYENESNKDCEGKKSGGAPAGIVVGI